MKANSKYGSSYPRTSAGKPGATGTLRKGPDAPGHASPLPSPHERVEANDLGGGVAHGDQAGEMGASKQKQKT